MKIYLYASEIATYLGLNIYRNISEEIEKLWERVDPNGYEEIHKKYYEESGIKIRKKEEKIREIMEKTGVREKLEETEQKINDETNIDELNELKNNIKEEIKKKINNVEDAKLVDKYINQKFNTNFGINNETSAIEQYEIKFGDKVTIDTNFYSRQVGEINNIPWFIGGKIDGRTDTHIIEIKNRMNRLFKIIPSYEKAQLLCYLYILESQNLHTARLIQRLKKDHSCMDYHDISFDHNIWKTNVEIPLSHFVSFFTEFILSPSLQMEYLSFSPEDKETFVKLSISSKANPSSKTNPSPPCLSPCFPKLDSNSVSQYNKKYESFNLDDIQFD